MFKTGKKQLLIYFVTAAVLALLAFGADKLFEGTGLYFYILFISVALLFELYIRLFRLERSMHNKIRESVKANEAWQSIYSFLKFRQPLAQLSSFAAAPDFAQYIMAHIIRYKPAVVYELGCGFSTMIVAKTAEMYSTHTRLISLEADAAYLKICAGEIQSEGVQSYVQLIHAPYQTIEINNFSGMYYTIPEINQKINLLIVDGPPKSLGSQSRYPAFYYFKNHLASDGFIICDDAARDDMQKTLARWKNENADLEFQEIPLTRGACLIHFRDR